MIKDLSLLMDVLVPLKLLDFDRAQISIIFYKRLFNFHYELTDLILLLHFCLLSYYYINRHWQRISL